MKNNYFENIELPKGLDESIVLGINKAQREKKKKRNKIIIVTISLSIVIVGSTVAFNDQVSANIKKAFGSIASYLGVDEDLDETTKIAKSVSKNGYTVTINEVVLDKNELIVSTTLKSDKGEFEGYIDTTPNIYINKEKIDLNSNGISEPVDESTINKVDTYFLDNELSGDVNISIRYPSIYLIDDTDDLTIEGPWSFEINTNADALAKSTRSMDLEETIQLDSEETITFKRYSSNNLGARIEFERSNSNSDYSIKLMGKDDLGNDIEFYVDFASNEFGMLKLDNEKGKISKDASKLTLNVYVSKVFEEDTWSKVEKEVIINLKPNN